MTTKLAALFLLSLLIVAFLAATVALGADKQQKRFKDRASIPARFAPTYSFPSLTGSEYTAPPAAPERNLRGDKAGEGVLQIVGTTTYGYQHNCTMARQIEHDARQWQQNPDPLARDIYAWYLHMDWMAQTHDTLGSGRGIGYQAYSINSCARVFAAGGIRIEGGYSGYVSMDADTGWAMPAAHENDDGTYFAKAFWDFKGSGIPAMGIFTSDMNNTDIYGWVQNAGTGPDNENIWPVHDWDIDGAEEVLHMVTTESGGAAGDPQNFSYYRRTGPYGTGLGVWSDQRLIDSAMNINVTVASSPISDKVAIVWNAPADYLRDGVNEHNNQYENDIWFAIATDNGASWASVSPSPSIGNTVDLGLGVGYNSAVGGNLTTYDPMNDYKAYCDISALWYIVGEQDHLQIVWGCRRWTDTTSLYRRSGAIFHWNQYTDSTRTVVKADWDSGGACYGHAWGTDAAKMTISQCEEKLYVCYTQFGSKTNPCGDVDATDQVVNGYLYMSVFDPGYDAWDRAQRVTPTDETPDGCIPGNMSGPGDCNSEYWSSMARYSRFDTCKVDAPGDNVLDILYINDFAPGGCVQTESGVWTVNDVVWATYPCREAVPEPDYSDDAGLGYGLCVNEPILVLGTTDDTTFVLMMENNGILANTPVSIVITGGSPNTTITATPNSGINIPPKGGKVPVDIDISTVSEADNSTVTASIDVTYQVGNPPTPETRNIPLCITVSDSYIPLESATLATTCKQLRVYNNGQMANGTTNETLDFMDDEDDCANVYLYDGSPIVCRDDAGTIRCYFTVYDNDYGSDHAMRQMTAITTVDSADYTMAAMEYITGDSTIRFRSEYYVPKDAGDCGYIIEKIMFWNQSEVALTGVAVGQVLDWDIPNYSSDSGTAPSDNSSGFDASRDLVYQYTCYADECDTLVDANRYGGVASYKGSPFKNYMILENDVWVYTTGPFEQEAPLPDDTTYGLMIGNDGPTTIQPDPCEDLTTLVTFGVYDLEPNDTICVVKILSTSKNDLGAVQLKANIDAANDFIDAHEEIMCPITDPCVADPTAFPGDANGDMQINVGDAVYTINYVFKGGPPPTPYPILSGDGNGDCQTNVGDAVYTINYVFKGGPPPVTCQEWLIGCGPPLR